MTDAAIVALLRCPDCRSGKLAECSGLLRCESCTATFPVVRNRPVLIRHDNRVFPIDAYLQSHKEEYGAHPFARFFPRLSADLASRRMLGRLARELNDRTPCHVLVVGAGRQRERLDRVLRQGMPDPQIIFSDVDLGADIDLFCDGHDLPFIDGSFDAVITMAVLEHVISPERVVQEIARVLKPYGLVYSEVPFMQQVHEGAYDFTRYSLSGHRRLFREFTEIDVGMVAGPAAALLWSIENLALAMVRPSWARHATKGVVRLLLFWIKYLDYLLKNRPEAMDGASCTYFFGVKATRPVDDTIIVRRYVGGKAFGHF